MARKITVISLLMLACCLPSSLIYIQPNANKELEIQNSGKEIEIESPLPAPRKVKIEMLPDLSEADSIKISWERVPGAIKYRVYSCVAIQDTSNYVPFCIPVLDQNGHYIWNYLYSFNPKYGDPYTINFNDEQGYQERMYDKFYHSPWQLEKEITNNYYVRANNGERDRFFYVTAVR